MHEIVTMMLARFTQKALLRQHEGFRSYVLIEPCQYLSTLSSHPYHLCHLVLPLHHQSFCQVYINILHIYIYLSYSPNIIVLLPLHINPVF